jgi:hemerythrin-like domain-containing protein
VSATKAALIEGFRQEHKDLDAGMEAMTRTLDRLQAGVAADSVRDLSETRRFLQRVFVPHTEWEELTFYPALGDLLRAHGDPNAAMLIDHREIMARVDAFLALAERIEAGERDAALIDRARILAHQIRALVELHDRKEEEVYVALLRRHMSDRDAMSALAVGDQHGHD